MRCSASIWISLKFIGHATPHMATLRRAKFDRFNKSTAHANVWCLFVVRLRYASVQTSVLKRGALDRQQTSRISYPHIRLIDSVGQK